MTAPETTTRIRPRLVSGLSAVPVDGGVRLRAAGGTEITLSGARMGAWIDRLAPHLDGSRTVADLVRGLGAAQRTMVIRLVAALHEHDLVRDLASAAPHGLAPGELARYAAEIALIDGLAPSAEHRFERYRRSRTVVIGAGRTLAEAVQAVLRSGPRRVRAVVTDECPTDLGLLEAHGRHAAERDPAQGLRVEALGSAGGDMAELRRALSSADLVLHVSDLPVTGRAAMIDRLCAGLRLTLVQAVVTRDEAWIGPVCEERRPRPLWREAWARLTENRSRAGGRTEAPGPAAAALIAAQAAFAAFKAGTGLSLGEPPQMVRVDLATLRTTTHRIVPLRIPLTLGEPAFRREARALIDRPALDDTTFSRRVASIVDEQTGIIASIDEGGLRQVPLRVCRASARLPVSGRTAEAYGAALDFARARYRAATAVLEHRATDLLGGRTTDLWGIRLDGGEPCRVPPRSGGKPRPFVTAAGRSWSEAVLTALLRHCEATAPGLAEDGPPLLDLPHAELDEVGDAYRELLAVAGVHVRVHDLSSLHRVPMFAFSVRGRTVAHRAGATVAAAVRDGLEQVLLDYQARTSGDLAYAPPRPAGPSGSRHRPPVRAFAAVADAEPLSAGAIAGRLVPAPGRVAVAVTLDQDPEAARALPATIALTVAATRELR